MNPEVVVSLLSTAVAALFGALMFTLRQQREDWKGLYDQEAKAHAETRLSAAADAKENTAAIRDLTTSLKETMAFIHKLPRRATDVPEDDRRSVR